MSDQIQFVFREDVTAERALKTTSDAVAALSSPRFDKEAVQRPADTLEIHRWRQQGTPPTAIDLTVDGSIPAVFVSVLSRDRQHAAELAAKLDALLRLPTAREFAAVAAQNPEDGGALLRAALAAGSEPDAALEQLVVDGLQAAGRSRRATAIKAAALLAWPTFVPALERARAGESDAELQRFLVIASKKCSG